VTLIPILLDFWFKESGPEHWFAQSVEFDDLVLRRFFKLHEQAAEGRLHDWEKTPGGALGLCLLMDQFPRNMFRGTPRAFATDAEARRIAKSAVSRGFDHADGMTDEHRLFFYLPLVHSESMEDQDRAYGLVATLASNPEYLKWAEGHRAIIKRFGRFPHRNEAMGRRSTEEELAFLETEEGKKF
jgi:uncharacterized protein (DUF924 family)